MSGRNAYSELRGRMTLEARAAADARADALDSSVARLEKRADMYVSTLHRFVEAMGGELEIVARFPRSHRDDPQLLGPDREGSVLKLAAG